MKTFDKQWNEVHETRNWGKYPAEELVRFMARNFPVAQRHDFFIGRRILDQQKYALFSQRWQKLTGLTPQILLHYHYGANDENL